MIDRVEYKIEKVNRELRHLKTLNADDKERKLDIEAYRVGLLTKKLELLSELRFLLERRNK